MNQEDFKNFFEPYAKNVDSANSLCFWKLSDEIITEIIKRHIPIEQFKSKTIFDAGGGTGRWICDLSKLYESNFVLYDLSDDMLEVAEKNIGNANIQDRVKIVQGDLTDMNAIADESVDAIVSIYSPISFIYEKEKAMRELYRILKPGGVILIMGHGFHNAIASKINNYLASASELLEQEKTSMVKWGDHVPLLNTFSKESMEGLLCEGGFQIVTTYGVPVFVQPGPEDFEIVDSQKSRVSKALEQEDFYREVFVLEMKYNSDPAVANRGMNMFCVATK